MKHRTIKLLSLLLLILTVVSIPVMAEEAPKLPDIAYWEGQKTVPGISTYRLNLPDGAKLTGITSSKIKVMKAELEGDEEFILWPVKAGKSKITLTYKVGKKKGTLTKTYHVYAYPNPLASLKVDGRKVDLKKNKFDVSFNKYKKTTTTIIAKPSKGWKIVGREFQELKGDSWDCTNIKSLKSIKSKKKKDFFVLLTLQNTKGHTIEYEIFFGRK